jgi:hypothetical protein
MRAVYTARRGEVMLRFGKDTETIRMVLDSFVGKCAMSDREIASKLEVRAATVCYWRKRLGIRPAEKFEKKFRVKHGPDSLDVLFGMLKTQCSYAEIGRVFGFTREYARQLGNRFSEVRNGKKEETDKYSIQYVNSANSGGLSAGRTPGNCEGTSFILL